MKVVERCRSVDRRATTVVHAGEGAVDAPTKAVEGRKADQVFLPARSRRRGQAQGA